MRNILIVTTSTGFFAQNKMPWSSMDVRVIADFFSDAGFSVDIVDFNYLCENINGITENIIIYTSSQRVEHKKYIEDVVFLLQENNVLVPSFEAFMAHDNKGFQCILDKKYNLSLIPSKYYSDISEIDDDISFPCVFKPANGASSTGVSIVHDVGQLTEILNDVNTYTIQDLKRNIKKYFFPKKYNRHWEEYISFGRKRFVLQEFIPNLKYDYKVLIFGKKFYVLKRFVAKNDFRASGSGIHARDLTLDDKELLIVLNKADEFRGSFRSHIYSLDVCVVNNVAYLIEFQFTHVGPVTLSESGLYYARDDSGEWEVIITKSNLENEFCLAVLEYINENSPSCA
ncbi:RimK family alpha-L-glutamate ligase [Aeromonas sp. A-5]|uniref:ATP-grasp domain-containing protein n=1 Tax=Aeromonas ichthyocola TaxID=3367746 RepID=UPI0038E689FC